MTSLADSKIDAAVIEHDAVTLAGIAAPTGSEETRLRWIAERLAAAPGQRSRDDVGNLVWRLGQGRPALALLVHADTVFAEDVPHTVVERDGWLCGPGIGDNALALAVAISTVELVAPHLRAPLAVVFTVGEEGLGGLRGARHACAALQPRLAVALEGHGLDVVYAEAVGCVRVQISARTQGGHSWWDRGRPSALHVLVALLAELLADPGEDVVLNVGRLIGGEAVNAIAEHAEATVEARSLEEGRLDEFHDRVCELMAPDGAALSVETVDRRPAGRLQSGHPLLRTVLEERAALGLASRLSEGSTDANAALALGIPALAMGCGRGSGMHTTDERIERHSIALGAAQLERVLRRLLADEPAKGKEDDSNR